MRNVENMEMCSMYFIDIEPLKHVGCLFLDEI